MDYMLQTLTDKDGDEYHKFQIKRNVEWLANLRLSGDKTAKAIHTAELMIDAQRDEIDNVLNKLIFERIGPNYSCFTDDCGTETHSKAWCQKHSVHE